MKASDSPAGTARYKFRVRFRIEPSLAEVSVDPAEFETTLYRSADPPGEAGWLFFRDHLWRGDLGDETYLQEVAEDALGVPVVSVSFSELQTDQAYLDALRNEIGGQLDEFRAETVDEALKKYLGSSIHVVSRGE
ncbi:LWR-salt protein [Halapricum hydrolyticum]|uniref:LWR-salt protein n=1 Tax=Halapricum hydrolyticum TaxID=2979991 RepID=A0AAE3LIS7_9EURY|nr:LWR-salt protein [Halapricum hydrolyticum]MCU4717454.1 LWR-salt protein [Halapricum hydrolyticum]MCU4726618.1 LWR-salt protein [Halapricum hydrolyticum]